MAIYSAAASNAYVLSNLELKAINDMMERNKKLSELYCTGFGLCETKCPQKLKIREQLKESHIALSR
jgi:predicted aldo/keto reductase-like oxidoreductase